MRVISVFLAVVSFLGLLGCMSGLLSVSSITANAASLGVVTIDDEDYELSSEHPYYVVVPESVEVGKSEPVYIGGNINGSVCLSIDKLLLMTQEDEESNSEICQVKLGDDDNIKLVGTSQTMETPSVAKGDLLVTFKDGSPLRGKWSGTLSYVLSEDIEQDMTDSLKYKLSADGTYYTITGVADTDIFANGNDRLYFPSYYNGKPIKAIGDEAFFCSGLHPLNGISNHSHAYTVIIPDTITSIGDFAFSYFGGEGTKFFIEGNSLKTIGLKAFRYSKMTHIFLPSSLEKIGSMAFYQTNLESIEIPSSVKTFGEYVFYYSTNLKTIVLPESVEKMAGGLFIGCSGLESVFWNCKLSAIPYNTFSGCSNLKTFVMSSNAAESLRTIGSKAFLKCSALKIFTIPSNVTLVEDYAFYSSGIETINCPLGATVYENSFPKGCEIIRT